MVLRVGVTCVRYVCLEHARPWVIHAFRNIKGRGLHVEEEGNSTLPLPKQDDAIPQTVDSAVPQETTVAGEITETTVAGEITETTVAGEITETSVAGDLTEPASKRFKVDSTEPGMERQPKDQNDVSDSPVVQEELVENTLPADNRPAVSGDETVTKACVETVYTLDMDFEEPVAKRLKLDQEISQESPSQERQSEIEANNPDSNQNDCVQSRDLNILPALEKLDKSVIIASDKNTDRAIEATAGSENKINKATTLNSSDNKQEEGQYEEVVKTDIVTEVKAPLETKDTMEAECEVTNVDNLCVGGKEPQVLGTETLPDVNDDRKDKPAGEATTGVGMVKPRLRDSARIRKRKMVEEPAEMVPEVIPAVSTYDRVRLVIQPWRKPEGGINKPILKMMLESVMLFLMMNPGSSEKCVLARYSPYLQPVILENIVQILEDIGCVTRSFLKVKKPTLFSKPSIPEIYSSDAEDRVAVYHPTEECLFRLGQFGKHFFPGVQWPATTTLFGK